jgi:hypothetical protein
MAPPASLSANTHVSHLTPAKAELARILHLPGGNSRERALLSWADGLDERDIKSMIAAFITHPDYSNQNPKIMTLLLERLAKLDPPAALGLLKGICIHLGMPYMLSAVLVEVSVKDPAAAFAAISKLPAGGAQNLSFLAVLSNLVDQDPQAALDALREHRSLGSAWIDPEIFEKWAGKDPSSAASAALNLPPSADRNNALINVAAAWAAQDPAGALAWANGLPAGSEKTNAVNAAIKAMALQDPTTAAAAALQLPGSSNRNELLGDVATNWAQTDPAGALAWADKNLTGDAFLSAATGVLNQMGQTDPRAAAAALAQIPDLNVIAQAVPDLATNWAQQDAPAAMQWAQSLPADNVAVRNSAFTNVLKIWSASDPAGAANYIQQNLAGDPSFSTLATQVVNSWGSSDPQAALTWAQSLPPGDAQNGAVLAAVTQLANDDPQAAWNAAEQLSGSSRNQALANVIGSWANQNPAAAAAAAQNALSLPGLSPAQLGTLQKIAAQTSAP